MKAFGTITACFPYIDPETRDILQAAMDEAKDYDDFAEILCNKACVESFNPLTIYFAYFFAFKQEKFNPMDRLQEARKYSDLAKPLLLIVQCHRGVPVEWSEFQKTLSVAINAIQSDWIACHIYMAWRKGAEQLYTECSTDSGPLGILESKIERDSEFSFFSSDLYHIKARRLDRERSIDEAVKMYNLGITKAKKYDNLPLLADLLGEKADLVKRTNISEALSILELGREVCEEIGYVAGLAYNDHYLGHIAMAKGEFNLSLHYQNKRLQNLLLLGAWVGHQSTIIAQLYNMMGDGANALDSIASHRNEIAAKNIPFALIHEAWALVNLDRIDDAEESITKARELVLKSDDEVRLGLVYFVEGLIEKSRHEFASAHYSFEHAVEIFERNYNQAFLNVTFFHLTDMEIEAFKYEKVTKAKISGPWMQKLMKQVEERELPGLAMQALLLRAKFRFKQGQIAQSRRMLKRVLKSSDTFGLNYLKDMAEAVIPTLFIT